MEGASAHPGRLGSYVPAAPGVPVGLCGLSRGCPGDAGPQNPLFPAEEPEGAAGLAAGPRPRGFSVPGSPVPRARTGMLQPRIPLPSPCALPPPVARGKPRPGPAVGRGYARGEPGDARGRGSGREVPRMLRRCPAGAEEAAAIAPTLCVSLPRGIPPRVSVPVSSAVVWRVKRRSGGAALCPCSLPRPTGTRSCREGQEAALLPAAAGTGRGTWVPEGDVCPNLSPSLGCHPWECGTPVPPGLLAMDRYLQQGCVLGANSCLTLKAANSFCCNEV